MKSFLKKYLFSLFLFFPVLTFAHTKWFAEEGLAPFVPDENYMLYAFAWGVIAFIIVGIGIFLDKYLEGTRWREWKLISNTEDKVTSGFGLVIGIFLLVASYNGFIFSVNLDELGVYKNIWLIVQAFIGLSLLIGFAVRIAALLLIGLWVFASLNFGLLELLENIWVLGGALFALIHGRTHYRVKSILHDRFFNKYEKYALPILRVATGLNLILLGFSEKLLRPEIALSFLEQYKWNFMQNFGIEWFSDYLFVFSAGAVEIIFGLVFVLGIVPRINAIAIAVFFTMPLFILGPLELIGHTPHFAIVVILILFGGGDRLKLLRG